MAVAGPEYRFSYIDVGGYGRQSDSGTWAACRLGKALQESGLAIPEPSCPPGMTEKLPYMFVADPAFPLSSNLMRPFPGHRARTLTRQQRIFNYRLL